MLLKKKKKKPLDGKSPVRTEKALYSTSDEKNKDQNALPKQREEGTL